MRLALTPQGRALKAETAAIPARMLSAAEVDSGTLGRLRGAIATLRAALDAAGRR